MPVVGQCGTADVDLLRPRVPAYWRPMGTVHKFRRRPKNHRQFRGWRPNPNPKKRPPKWGYAQAMLATFGVAVGALIALTGLRWATYDPATDPQRFQCSAPDIVDGDTLHCAGGIKVRLAGIDAPELPGHCRPGRSCTPGDPYASTENLRKLVAQSTLECRRTDTDVYGRTVARCTSEGRDLSCSQIAGNFAIRRYGMIWC